MPAFRRAIELGADGIELDVHLSADGVPVVHHDPDVLLSPSSSAKRSIAEIPWRELSRVELAPDVPVPSLEQVLELTGDTATVYVELKGKDVERASIDVIRASRARCALHSFDHSAVARAARLAPEIRRGILFDEYPDDVVASMRAAEALDVWPQCTSIDRSLVERVHAAGGRVIAWTVNAASVARRLVEIGVDGLCGDDVRLLPH